MRLRKAAFPLEFAVLVAAKREQCKCSVINYAEGLLLLTTEL